MFRAERKTKERRRRFRPVDRKESASPTPTSSYSRSGPPYSASGQSNRRVYSSLQRLGPCFKILSTLDLLCFTFGFMALLPGRTQYSPVFVVYFCVLFSNNFW